MLFFELVMPWILIVTEVCTLKGVCKIIQNTIIFGIGGIKMFFFTILSVFDDFLPDDFVASEPLVDIRIPFVTERLVKEEQIYACLISTDALSILSVALLHLFVVPFLKGFPFLTNWD